MSSLLLSLALLFLSSSALTAQGQTTTASPPPAAAAAFIADTNNLLLNAACVSSASVGPCGRAVDGNYTSMNVDNGWTRWESTQPYAGWVQYGLGVAAAVGGRPMTVWPMNVAGSDGQYYERLAGTWYFCLDPACGSANAANVLYSASVGSGQAGEWTTTLPAGLTAQYVRFEAAASGAGASSDGLAAFAEVVIAPPPQCSNPPSALVASEAAYLDAVGSGFTSMDNLRLMIKSTRVDNRPAAVVTLPAGQDCPVPALERLLSAEPDCQEVLTLNFNWTSLRPCLTVTQVGTKQVFRGAVRVTQTDLLDTIRGQGVTRTTISDLEYTLSFETEVSLTVSSVTVFAPVNVISAVVMSRVVTTSGNSSTPVRVEVAVFTSVQGPYQLGQPNVSATGLGRLTVSAAVPQCTKGGPCSFTTLLVLEPNTCSPSGPLTYRMPLGCTADTLAADCPLGQGPVDPVTVTVFLPPNSVSFCGQLAKEYGLTGAMTTHQSNTEAGWASVQNAFLAQDTIYVKSLLASAEASILSSQIKSLTLNGVPVARDATNAWALISPSSSNGGLIQFSFRPKASVFAPPTGDGRRGATLVAVVTANFANGKRSDYLVRLSQRAEPASAAGAGSNPSADMEQQAVYEVAAAAAAAATAAPPSGPAEPAGTKAPEGGRPDGKLWIIGLVLGLLSACAALVVVAALVRRRRRQQQALEAAGGAGGLPVYSESSASASGQDAYANAYGATPAAHQPGAGSLQVTIDA